MRTFGEPSRPVTQRNFEPPLSDFRRFVAQISWSGWQRIGPFMLLLIVLCVADSVSDVGDNLPFVTNVVAGLLLLGLTITFVDEFLRFRAAERWAPVAAFALEDLGRVTRAVWVRNGHLLQPPLETLSVEQFRLQVASLEGQQQQREAVLDLVATRDGRNRIYDDLRETAKRTREIIISWSPTLVAHERIAPFLAQLTDVHRRIVRLLQFLHHERAGRLLPIEPEDVADQILEIQLAASRLDTDLMAEAADVHQLPGTVPARA